MLTKKQVAEIRKIFNNRVLLGDVPVGDVVTIGDLEFVVLEHSKDTTAIIYNGLSNDDVVFGKTNNFKGSTAYDYCTAFTCHLCTMLGTSDPVIEHSVNLTAADGLKDYGKITAYGSLLTAAFTAVTLIFSTNTRLVIGGLQQPTVHQHTATPIG